MRFVFFCCIWKLMNMKYNIICYMELFSRKEYIETWLYLGLKLIYMYLQINKLQLFFSGYYTTISRTLWCLSKRIIVTWVTRVDWALSQQPSRRKRLQHFLQMHALISQWLFHQARNIAASSSSVLYWYTESLNWHSAELSRIAGHQKCEDYLRLYF